MIGIESVASYLPPGRINNLGRAEEIGSTREQVELRIGFRELAIKAPTETTLSMATEALSRALSSSEWGPSELELVVVVTQNPDRRIPHISADLHGKLGLPPRCACFDIGLGCSGYVYGLSVVSAFMAANGMSKGALVTADPYSRIVDQHDKNTSLIFGDGATATLMSSSPRFTLGSFTFGTQGAEADKLACNDGRLFMNGRAVFNFAATNVPLDIERVIAENGLTLDKIDRFIVHQGSRFIVETIADRLKVPREKMPFLAAQYGNTVSSSIPMILAETLADSDFQSAVLGGFGLGFSWASTVLQRQKVK